MKVTQNTKVNFFKEKAGAVLTPIDFLREVKVELEKVVWPTKEQTIKLTITVILVTLIVGFFIGGIDFLLQKIVEILLKSK